MCCPGVCCCSKSTIVSLKVVVAVVVGAVHFYIMICFAGDQVRGAGGNGAVAYEGFFKVNNQNRKKREKDKPSLRQG